MPKTRVSLAISWLITLTLIKSSHSFGIPPSLRLIPPLSTKINLVPQQLGSFEALDEFLCDYDRSTRKVTLLDWSAQDPIGFQEAWDIQKAFIEQHLQRINANESQFETSGGDLMIMLQHDPVFTLGTGSDPAFLLSDNIDIVRMDRGGEVTYHGPGQLVVYPLLDLRGYRQDIHWYMRALEEATLLALHKVGVRAERQDDVTGVWIDNKKVAAFGIKVKRWVTMHGLAINIEQSSLANFEGIVPCGLEGREVTCVNNFIVEPLTVAEFAGYLKEALEEVFCICLVETEL